VVGTQEVGIVVGTGSKSNTVTGNVIGGHRAHGVLIGDQTWRGTSGNTVSSNHIGRTAGGALRPNGGYGVFLWNTRSNTITGNAFGANTLGRIGQAASSGNLIG
jgi:nitrous oxidase accessory protein NosD